MSKMKRLLRKLHFVNSDHHDRRRNSDSRPPEPPSSSSSSSSSSPPSISAGDANDRTTVRESSPENVNVNNVNAFFEEEFQVQLAMALSASDQNDDQESDQIKAAKELSLVCSPAVPDNERFSESLSVKYWNYNVVQYNERLLDGFYDAYAIASNSIAQGKMPLLVDLQTVSILDDLEYEVVLVNRSNDFQLRLLENKVYAMSVECGVLGHDLPLNGLIQRIADLVVDRMGGPVGDTEEMMKRWRRRTNQLRASYNTTVLPLGCLDVGLSRHRALLFKVLADRINLPCMLVKGSLYTGTDDGAVNLIKFDDGSEYIIDLMGAPGTLIPSEVPSSLLLDTALDPRGYPGSTAAAGGNLSLVLNITDVGFPDVCGSNLKGAASVSMDSVQETAIATGSGILGRLDYKIDKPFKSEFSLSDGLPSPVEEASLVQEKVKDVSKYVISAAKDPQFAQKLHAVLLESGASPPPDLFSNINPGILNEKKFRQVHPLGQEIIFSEGSCNPEDCRSKDEVVLQGISTLQPLNNCVNKRVQCLDNSIVQPLDLNAKNALYSSLYSKPKIENVGVVAVEAGRMRTSGATANIQCAMLDCDGLIFQDTSGKFLNQMETGEEITGKSMEVDRKGCLASCNGHSESLSNLSCEICPMLGEFAGWEIPWEDLHIGERIGIGSYGEVYRADWNGTEVAVKKFLIQDFTTDVLNQFKCEAEMMIRLRHPNVVLFMGAVTRPPNLSILTEFLPRGSLYKLLHRSGTRIDEKKRMKMALDVARGMNYLHTSHPTIVHRDLKSPNLLVNKNWGVKVCDFGLSRLKHHTYLSSNSSAGTPEWMAPEVLRNEPSNEKCDVYSFGVILWELATLCKPWTGLNPMQVVGAVGFQNRRLDISGDIDPAVAQIIRDCWENDPQLRPSFSQLISRLKGLQRLVVQRE